LDINHALEMSWELLNLSAESHRRKHARETLELMIACQGDQKSWGKLRDQLQKILK
jgi:hypothetical protein